MQKDYQMEHEMMRKELWIKVWLGATNANMYKDTEDARTCADIALKNFDSRFPAPGVEDPKPQKTDFPTINY